MEKEAVTPNTFFFLRKNEFIWNSNSDDQEMESLSCKMRLKKVWHVWLNETKIERGYDISFILISVYGEAEKASYREKNCLS